MITLASTDSIQGVAGTASAITCTITGMERIAAPASQSYKRLYQGVLPSSAGSLYSPSGVEALIKEIFLANTTGLIVTGIKIFVGGSGTTNQLVQMQIPANGSAVYNGVWNVYDSTGLLLTGTSLTLTGDVTGTGAGTIATTLATVNATFGTFGSNTRIPTFTVNAKGLMTASSDAPVLTSPAGQTPVGTTRAINTTAPITGGGDLSADRTIAISAATTSTAGSMSAAQFSFVNAFNGSGIIFVTANAYSNLSVNGSTDDLAAINTLFANAPDGSILVWPGQNATMVLSGAASIPAGKHFIFQGGGPGGKTHILQTSLTADHFTCNDWYSTFTGFDFTTNNTTTTAVQALTSGTVLTVASVNTALTPATGSITVGSATGWQVLTYSARTATTVTLSSTGTGNSVAGAPLVFKTAGAAINAGNLVGIDCQANSFSYVFNGYICSGSTANQSRITGNTFLNTINFDIQIDGANWNGIIDSNTCDCTTNSRSVSHCEINQCGSITGQGNQFIRGQSNLRLGSTTAAYPAGVFGVYFSDTFFDNAGVDAIKIQGISAVQRVKISSCWISSAAQKGVNFASTATTLPSDIDLIGNNIYANGTDGIGGAGVGDYRIIGGEIAGNTTNGLNIAPATGNVYSVFAQGVRIGPTGGFGANGTGITIGAGTYTMIKIDGCDVTGNTTTLTAGAVTVALASRYAITNNAGLNPLTGAAVTTPTFPTSTTVVTNTTGRNVVVFLKGGTVSAITLNGVANTTTATNQAIHLVAGGTIAITFSVAATWTWIGE